MTRGPTHRKSAVRPPPRDLFSLRYSPPFLREKERLIDLDHLRPKLPRVERHICRIAALVLLVLLNRVLINAPNLARLDELDIACSTCSAEVRKNTHRNVDNARPLTSS